MFSPRSYASMSKFGKETNIPLKGLARNDSYMSVDEPYRGPLTRYAPPLALGCNCVKEFPPNSPLLIAPQATRHRTGAANALRQHNMAPI